MEIEGRLCELFEREEIMAKQRSRIDWLKEGDRNTAFFHARATSRRRTNIIQYLVRDDGSKCEDQAGLKGMAQSFYENLFSSEPCDSLDAVLESIPVKVTAEINEDLCKEYTEEEIKFALFQMGPTKAPGPDGFPALFYQKHWTLLKNDICAAVWGFLSGDVIPEGFCDSVLVLIPKVSKPSSLTNFRPISLCNVIYKIASKVVSNRLKVYLPEMVNHRQCSYFL
jgi:hypothetical protein